MATIKFLTRGNNNPTSIYIRLRDGRNTDITVSTGKTINPKYWGKHGVKQSAEFHDKLNLQNDLSRLRALVESRRNISVTSNDNVNREWLEKLILEWMGKYTGEDSDYLIDRINAYRDKLPTLVKPDKTIGVSPATLRNYNTTIKRIQKFEQHKKQRYALTDLDLTFYENYIRFAQKNLGLAKNSIGKDIKQIKTVCYDSKDLGFKVHEQVFSKKFKAPREKTTFTTLTRSDIDKLMLFKGRDYLENARNWLIIGCWTGCRVGDLMKLTEDNIMIHSTGNKFLRYTQSKTGKTVNVPIHPHLIQIISESNGFPRAISDQKFNKYIKEVCRLSGLTEIVSGSKQNRLTKLKEDGEFEKWELVKSHTCRRSFATNHYKELPNKIIMAVTGHATEAMLLAYIGVEDDDSHIQEYIQYWEDAKHKTTNTIDSMQLLK